jgi:hypothetical protein
MYSVGSRIRFKNFGNGVLEATIIKRDFLTRQYRLTYLVNGERFGKIKIIVLKPFFFHDNVNIKGRWVNENEILSEVREIRFFRSLGTIFKMLVL